MLSRSAPRSGVAAAALTALLVAALTAGLARPAAAEGDTVTLTLVATNDFHRQLAPVNNPGGWDHGLGGAAWLAAHLDAVRARAANVLHVDAGDLTGGGSTGVPNVSRGYADEAVVDVMNRMGLDVTTVGNHEFDAGGVEAQRIREGGCWMGDCSYRGGVPYAGADFTTLGANVTTTATGAHPFPAWTIREVAGVKVGFVGATDIVTIPRLYNEHLTFADPFGSAISAVDEVRAAGADLVVLLFHNGSKQKPAGHYDANACEGIDGPSTWLVPWVDADVIVDGHTHGAYVCDFPGMALMTQASERGLVYTEITLTIDTRTGTVVSRSARNHQVTHDLAPDPAVAAIVDSYRLGKPLVAAPVSSEPAPSEPAPSEPAPSEPEAPVVSEPSPSPTSSVSGNSPKTKGPKPTDTSTSTTTTTSPSKGKK